jgi:multiple sugar transport system permease protein
MRPQNRNLELLWHLPLVLLALTMLAPLCFMFVTALSSPEATMSTAGGLTSMLIPTEWRWGNFLEVWEKVPFLRYYLNSLAVSLVVTLGQVTTSACAAYAFSRLRWPGRDTLFLCYLATMMIPGAVTLLPNFIAMKLIPELMTELLPVVNWMDMRYLGSSEAAPLVGRIAGLDSFFALIVPGMFSAYGTFMLRQFLLTIPRDLEEAARIDGAGYLRTFLQIILPLALPGLATLTIFTFMGSWGSFLWPLVTVNQDDLRTLPLGLQAFQGQYGTEWHLMMAAALLMLLPTILIFLLGQRFFVSGLTVGAVKG